MKTVQLTEKEIKIITKALNYTGNKIADAEGYSSGEEYWDVANKLIDNER